MSSDPNGLCLTMSNTSSLVSNSSSTISTTKSNISNKFKNVLNRKRSKSLMIPQPLEHFPIRSTNRNKSVSSIQYSPSQSVVSSFENLRSNSTSSISDSDLEGPITPITPLFRIKESEISKDKKQNSVIQHNEEIFDSIADGILEKINDNKNESTTIDWTI